MKSSCSLFFLFISSSLLAQELATTPTKTLDNKLGFRTLGIRAYGKIDYVVWSVERTGCVVWVKLASVPEVKPPPSESPTQVWLLKSDGTAISQSDKPFKGVDTGGGPTDGYLFPQAAATEAVAVVVKVDGQFFVASMAAVPERIFP